MSDDNLFGICDLVIKKGSYTLAGLSPAVKLAVVSQDHAVSVHGDNTLKGWDLEAGQELHTLAGHKQAVKSVIAPKMVGAVSGLMDWTLKVWDLETGRELHTLVGHMGVLSVAVTQDERHAVSASYDNTLRVWDLETGKNIATWNGESVFMPAQ